MDLIDCYPNKEIASYRDKEKRSFLYLAIEKENFDLIEKLLPYYNSSSFFERTGFSSYTKLAAAKCLNKDITQMVLEYMQDKELQEYMQREW